MKRVFCRLESSRTASPLTSPTAEKINSRPKIGKRRRKSACLDARVRLHPIQAMGQVIKTDGKYVREVPPCCRKEFESLLWQIVLTHAGLCSHVIQRKKLWSTTHDQADLEQYGLFGLRRAAELFDSCRDIKFSTYACYWIRNSIQIAIHNFGRTIRVPVHLVSGQKACEKIPTILSLSQNEFGFEDWLCAPELPVFLNLELDETRRKLSEAVEKWLRTLSSRIAAILRARFGFADGRKQTLAEIAEAYGVTRERVRQLQSGALEKLASLASVEAFVEAEWWD